MIYSLINKSVNPELGIIAGMRYCKSSYQSIEFPAGENRRYQHFFEQGDSEMGVKFKGSVGLLTTIYRFQRV